MKHTTKILAALLLTLTMVFGLVPGMGLTAYADGAKAYAAYDVTTEANKNKSGDDLEALQVTFNDRKWYIIEDKSTSATSGTVTLLAADTTFGTNAFDSKMKSNKYSISEVRAYLDDQTKTGGAFAEVADAIETVSLTTNKYYSTDVYETVNGVKLYLLSTEEANSLPENVRKIGFTGTDCNYNQWWLRSPGNGPEFIAAYVEGDTGFVDAIGLTVNYLWGVRPALQLNLSSVTFLSASNTFKVGSAYSVTVTPGSNMTKTENSGAASQTDLSGAMTDVVYTANEGYYFPTDYSVAAVNGISVTRDSYTQITVSGTPTADAAITLTAPTAKTTPDAPTAASTDCTTADNNDGKLTGVTAAMEYKKSDAEDWTAGTGSDITGLVPGTYYVRVKATETTNASTNQELTIKGFISYTVTFKVVNGKWNEGEGDAATADRTVTLAGHDGDTLKLTADQIPAVGSKPNDTYKAGSWDTTPSADTEITADTTYTYTYAQKESISQTVTFKVVNGSWNDETTTDKTVTLTGYEGDTLKLTADQIPTVGTKPNDTYKAGSWDTTPSAETEITGATTYTYTYAQKDSISQTVTFKVVNGSWNDETTTDKTVTLTGYEGDTLKLTADQIPAVGTKPSDTYKAGSWDVTPSADTEITAATTYTYTYAAKEASVVTKAPEAKTLTYTGSAQELVTTGEAEGGTLYYAVTTENTAPTDENLYTTSIPTGTDAGT